MPETAERHVLWQFYDGKPGHDRQSNGLIAALADRIEIDVYRFDAKLARGSWLDFILRRSDIEAPAPNLVIGAGRRCQWPMLCAKRAYRTKLVYLMRPQWPRRWFDLCLIPRHDAPAPGTNIIVTDGVLNDIRPSLELMQNTDSGADIEASRPGLMLIGGPSDHVAWNEDAVFEQCESVLAANPDRHWLISDSRRTPASARRRLADLNAGNASFSASAHSGPDWLQKTLGSVGSAWVTSDSVSMIYECLSAGVALGVIEVPTTNRNRINTLIDKLAAENRLTRFRDWTDGTELQRSAPLAEAQRCAEILIKRFSFVNGSSR